MDEEDRTAPILLDIVCAAGARARDCAARRKFCRVRADDAHGPTDQNLKNQSFLPEVLALYRSSVFTFQPPGDSYARKGIFDSLSQGAIPAIFHPKSFDYPAFPLWFGFETKIKAT